VKDWVKRGIFGGFRQCGTPRCATLSQLFVGQGVRRCFNTFSNLRFNSGLAAPATAPKHHKHPPYDA
jgi:hypothetical protein